MHYLGFEFLNFSELHSGMMSLCGTGRPASVMLWYLKVPSKYDSTLLLQNPDSRFQNLIPCSFYRTNFAWCFWHYKVSSSVSFSRSSAGGYVQRLLCQMNKLSSNCSLPFPASLIVLEHIIQLQWLILPFCIFVRPLWCGNALPPSTCRLLKKFNVLHNWTSERLFSQRLAEGFWKCSILT
jgi:hypothetical protein